MAKQVPTFEFPTKGRPYKYDWSSWSDGSTWELTAGQDFKVNVATMRTNARSFAMKNNLKVKTALIDDGKSLVVKFTPIEVAN
jgi:hypothetical protein